MNNGGWLHNQWYHSGSSVASSVSFCRSLEHKICNYLEQCNFWHEQTLHLHCVFIWSLEYPSLSYFWGCSAVDCLETLAQPVPERWLQYSTAEYCAPLSGIGRILCVIVSPPISFQFGFVPAFIPIYSFPCSSTPVPFLSSPAHLLSGAVLCVWRHSGCIIV